MISVDEARARILADLRPLPAEIVALADAWGRVTAAPVIARLTQPPGRRLRHGRLRGARRRRHARTPRSRVIGAAPAGHPFDGSVGPGQTVRLFTGSVVPARRRRHPAAGGRHPRRRLGARQRGGDSRPPHPPRRPGFCPRRHGGARRPPHHRARRRPRRRRQPPLAQRAPPPARRHPGDRRRDRHAGRADPARRHRQLQLARPRRPGARRRRRSRSCCRSRADTREAVAAVADAVAGADMLVTTGGASVGDHDLVIEGAAKPRHGGGFLADRHAAGKAAAVRPARPDGGVPVLGLPGNPVSALVCAILFLLPALSRLTGLPAAPPPITTALLGEARRRQRPSCRPSARHGRHRRRRPAWW